MMKKTAMTLLALFCFLTAARAIEVQIGNENNLENAIPLYLNNNYSLTQQIYTAAEIGKAGGKAGTINSIAFYYHSSTSFSNEGVQMYMKLVDKDCFNSRWDMVAINTSDKVWEGTFSATGAGWVTINLTQPFEYDGIRNLLVCLYDSKDGKPFTSPANYFRVSKTTKRTSVYYFSDFYKPSLENNNYYNGDSNLIYYHCNIKLDITPNVCDTPTNFAVSDITPNGATFTWESDAGNYVFEYKKTSDASWTVMNGLTQCTFTLSSLAPATDYDIRVKAVCGAGSESAYNSSSFSTNEVCPEGKVCIGQGKQVDDCLPFAKWAYSITQQIYTADEIGQAGTITSLDFKVGTVATSAKLDIYITSTDWDEYDSRNFIPVTTYDLVFSGTVNFKANDWTTITLDHPFVYDGEDNIAILVDNNTGIEMTSSPEFYAFTSEKYQSLQRHDDTDFDPLNLPWGSNSHLKNCIRLGIEALPSCMKPKHVDVDYMGGTTAQVSWQSDGNTWKVALFDGDGRHIKTNYAYNTPSFTLTGLELNSSYSVEVCTLCDDDSQSEWAAPVSFTTDWCTIIFELTDSFGDGWKNNAIKVVDVKSGNLLGTFANENRDGIQGTGAVETNTFYLNVPKGREIKFVWRNDPYYSNQCSYVVKYYDGDVIIEGSGEGFIDFTHTVECNASMIGDANGDTDLDIKDVLAVVSYILGNAPEGFIEANADIDGVEGITISDAVAILNLILAGH